MSRQPIVRVAATVAGAALLLAACGGAPTTSPGATTQVVASASQAPLTTAAVASASPTAAPPIPDGTYLSGAQAITTFVAQVKDDTSLTAADRTSLLHDSIASCTAQFVSLDFHAGQLTEADGCDGAALQTGLHATYAFPDAHTLLIQETCCGTSTFTLTFVKDGFFLKQTSPLLSGHDRLISSFLYETSPFMLKGAAARAIPDGTWRTAPKQVSEMTALINGDAKLTASEKAQLLNDAFAVEKGRTTFTDTVALANGSWTESQAADGGAPQVGSRATVAFPDTQTVVIEEQGYGTTTFHVTWANGSFWLKSVPAQPDEVGRVTTNILFESSPFTLVP
jgi:hypothetical protein